MRIKKLRLIVVLIALFVISYAFPAIGDSEEEPELGGVCGYIYNTANEKPVREALVVIHKLDIKEELESNVYHTMTNGMGYYELLEIPPGNYRIMVFAPGYSELYWKLIPGPVCGIVPEPPYYDDLPPHYYYTLVYSYEIGRYSAYSDEIEIEDQNVLPLDIYLEPENNFSNEGEHRLWSNLIREKID
jgi:hypothetical protein